MWNACGMRVECVLKAFEIDAVKLSRDVYTAAVQIFTHDYRSPATTFTVNSWNSCLRCDFVFVFYLLHDLLDLFAWDTSLQLTFILLNSVIQSQLSSKLFLHISSVLSISVVSTIILIPVCLDISWGIYNCDYYISSTYYTVILYFQSEPAQAGLSIVARACNVDCNRALALPNSQVSLVDTFINKYRLLSQYVYTIAVESIM